MILWLAAGCARPPEAPEGLDNSLRFLFQSFYGSDDEVAAGLSGLVGWYDTEGHALIDQPANIDNVNAYELDPLRPQDVAELRPRPAPNPKGAVGVVAVAELPCRWKRAEDLLVRPDQADVFADFDWYDRSYMNSRKAFEDARAADDFPAVRAPLERDERASMPEVLLVTENQTAGTEMGVTIEFDLHMHARHGRFTVLDEEVRASLFVTWLPERASAEGGANSMEQSYTFELDMERGNRTLWVYGSWSEVDTSVFESDSAVLQAVSVNKAQGTAQRMADICDGTHTVGS
jgi:hypothetical protein